MSITEYVSSSGICLSVHQSYIFPAVNVMVPCQIDKVFYNVFLKIPLTVLCPHKKFFNWVKDIVHFSINEVKNEFNRLSRDLNSRRALIRAFPFKVIDEIHSSLDE